MKEGREKWIEGRNDDKEKGRMKERRTEEGGLEKGGK